MKQTVRIIVKLLYRWVDKVIENFSKISYPTARAYYHKHLKRADNRYKNLPLLVYQMGKVGSKTIAHSLYKANIERHIYHVHFLTPELVLKKSVKNFSKHQKKEALSIYGNINIYKKYLQKKFIMKSGKL